MDVCIYICICMYVCMYICMYERVCIFLCVCMHVNMNKSCIQISLRMYVSMYVCIEYITQWMKGKGINVRTVLYQYLNTLQRCSFLPSPPV